MTKHSDFIGTDRERLCLSVPEASRMLGISRGLGYELARCGKLPVIRLNRRLLVPKAALERMLDRCHDVSNSEWK